MIRTRYLALSVGLWLLLTPVGQAQPAPVMQQSTSTNAQDSGRYRKVARPRDKRGMQQDTARKGRRLRRIGTRPDSLRRGGATVIDTVRRP